eukprot:3941360-Amphidinium_carterae.3
MQPFRMVMYLGAPRYGTSALWLKGFRQTSNSVRIMDTVGRFKDMLNPTVRNTSGFAAQASDPQKDLPS